MRGKRFCPICGNKVNYRNKTYCSNKCQLEMQSKEFIKRWLRGEETGMRGSYQLSTSIREYLLKLSSYKCSKCDWGETNPFSKSIPLEIEHIDGNYTNNIPENLIVLCPNCHSLTKTYKGANKGNGRTSRKKYYKPQRESAFTSGS